MDSLPTRDPKPGNTITTVDDIDERLVNEVNYFVGLTRPLRDTIQTDVSFRLFPGQMYMVVLKDHDRLHIPDTVTGDGGRHVEIPLQAALESTRHWKPLEPWEGVHLTGFIESLIEHPEVLAPGSPEGHVAVITGEGPDEYEWSTRWRARYISYDGDRATCLLIEYEDRWRGTTLDKEH